MQFKYLSPKGHSSISKVAAFQVLIFLHTYATLYRSALSFGVFMLKQQRKPLPWLFVSLIWEGGFGEGSVCFSFFFKRKLDRGHFVWEQEKEGWETEKGAGLQVQVKALCRYQNRIREFRWKREQEVICMLESVAQNGRNWFFCGDTVTWKSAWL